MIATFDLGGTKLALGVADNTGKLHHTARIQTEDRTPADVFHDAAGFFRHHNFSTLGVASFGPLVGNCLSPSTPKIPWRNADLPQLLRGAGLLQPQTPFLLLQDVQAEVIGEAMLGDFGQDFARYAYVTLSTGIGASVYDKGRDFIYPACEAGHLPVPATTRGACESHDSCWEGHCSGTALGLKDDGRPHRMDDDWILRTATALYSVALTNTVDIIVLGGGVVTAWKDHGPDTIARLTKQMEELNNNYIPLPRLETARIPNRALAGIAIAASRWAKPLRY